MSSEILHLPDASFNETVRVLDLSRDRTLPLLRDGDGNIVLFRGQSEKEESLNSATYGGHDYGHGAYLGNTPTSVSSFAYDSGNVGVWRLPTFDEVGQMRVLSRRGQLKHNQMPVEVFPTRFTLAARWMCFSGERQDRGMTPHWVLIRDPGIYRAATLLARVGLSSIGHPRD